ncbi:hypothetical protein [Selenomonas sp. AE3005]|uniref:hypothetical protein n=1 Tax=Selenomonas sp. AE3005 TaxID=1485543 RepID=UPI0025DBE660|nr:hypothetical protein [Selenomonas sp. AE3005]
MAKCENCEHAEIARSRVVKQIGGTERMVSNWTIEGISCMLNRKTSIYSEIDCSDYRRADDGQEEEMGGDKTLGNGHWIEHPHEQGENWEYPMYECSACQQWANDDSNFCPNCGAKMKGGK